MNASKHVCDVAYCAGVLYSQALDYKFAKPSTFSRYIVSHYEKRMMFLVDAGVYEIGQGFTDTMMRIWFERGTKRLAPTKKMIVYYDKISRATHFPTWDEAQFGLRLDERWY